MDNPAINEQRSINVATVTKAVEQERTRRIEEDLQHSISTNEERKKNQIHASQMVEKERSRRMSETQTMNETISKSQELLKQSNVQMVTKLANAEQERRSSVVGGGNHLMEACLMQEIAAGSATETMTAADLARRLDEEERIADMKAVALKNAKAEALKKTKAAALQKAKAHALKKEEANRRAAKMKAKNKTAANAPNADSATDYTLRLSRLEAHSKVQLHRLTNIQNIIVPSVIETETTTTKSNRIYSVNDVRNKNHKNHKKASKKKIIRNATGSKQVTLNKNKVISNKHDSWTCYLCDVNYSWKNLKPHYYTHYPNCKDPAIMNTFLNKIRNNSILKNKITITPSKKSISSNVSPALTLKLSRLEAKNRVQLHRLNKIHCILDPSVIETKVSTKLSTKLSTKVSTEPLNLKPKKKKRKNQKKKLVQVATKEKKNNVFNFVCTNATKNGCTTNSLMGAPANLFKKLLKEINKETHILLYNLSTKCIYVGYTPTTGVAKMNIDPLVWPSNSKGKKSSKFPAQLRCECVHGDKKLIQIKLKDSDILPMFKRVGPVPYNIYEKLIERHTLQKTKTKVTTTGESKQNETKKKSKKKTKKNKEIQEKIQENNQIDNLICSVCELELSLKDIRCPACDYLIEPTSLSEMRTKRKARSLKEEQLLRPSKNDLDTIKCIEKYLKGRNYTALLHSILSDLKKKHSKMYKTFMLEHNEDLHQFLSKKFCFLTAATFAKIKKKNSLLRRNCVHAYWDKLQKKNQFLLKSDPRSLCLKSVVFEDQKREMQQKADALLVKKKKHEQANRNTRNIAKNATKSSQVNHKVSEPIKMTMGQKVRARRAREKMYARANTPVDLVQQEEHLRRATNLEKTNHNMAARQMAARRQAAIQSQNSRIYEFNNATPGMSGMSERSSNLNPNTNMFKPSQEIRKNCNHNPCLNPHYCMHNMTNSRNSRNSMNSMNSMNTMNSRNIRNNNTNLNAAHTILKVVQKKQNNTTAHEYTGLPTLDKLAHLSHHPDHQQYLQQMEFLSSRQKLNEQKKQLQQIKEKRAQLKQQRQTQLQQQRQIKAQVQAVAQAQAKAHATEQAHAQAQALADRRKKRMLLLKRQQDEELKRIEKRKKEAQQKAKEEEIKRQAEESMILQRLASEKEKRERMTSKQRAKNDMEEKRIEMYRSKLEKERQMKKEQKRINTIKEIEENQYNQEMERIRQQHLYQQNAIKAYEKKYVLKLLQRCITGWYNRAMNKEVRKLRLKTKSEKKRMNEKIAKQKKLKEEKLKNAKEKGKNNLMLNQKKKQALKLSEIYHMDVSSTETKTTVESIYEKREKYWKHSREKEEKHILLLREMCVWEFTEMENTTNATNGNSVVMNQVEQRTLRNELRQGRAYTRLFNASRHGYLRAIKKTRKGIYMECDENGNPGNSGNPSNPGKGGKESTKMTKMEVVLKGYDDINNLYIVRKSNKNNENNAEDNTDIYVESKYLIQPSNSQSLDSQISFIYVDVDTLINDMDFNIKIDISDFKIYMGVEPDDYVNGFPRWDKCLLGWINVRKSKIMEQELILNQKLQLEQAQIEYDLKHPTVEKIYTEDEKLLKTMEQNAKSIQKENDAQRRKERMQREAAALLASASEETRRKAARKKKERARHKKQIKRGNRMRKEEEERLKYLYRHINYMYGMHFFDDDNSDEDEYGDGDEYKEHRHFHRDQNERHHEAQLRRQKDQQSATVLGIDVNANANEIKESYRSLAKKYHPDKWHVDLGISKEEGQEKFKEISNAYQHLNA